MDYPRLSKDATAYAKELMVRGYSDRVVYNRLCEKFYFKDKYDVQRTGIKLQIIHKEIDEEYGKQ